MATIDQQFVEYIVKTLVNNPDKVSVDRKIDEKVRKIWQTMLDLDEKHETEA